MKVRFLVFILFQSTLGYGNYPEDEQCKVTRVVDCSHLESPGEGRRTSRVIPGKQGPRGHKGEQGVKGAPGERCDCSRATEVEVKLNSTAERCTRVERLLEELKERNDEMAQRLKELSECKNKLSAKFSSANNTSDVLNHNQVVRFTCDHDANTYYDVTCTNRVFDTSVVDCEPRYEVFITSSKAFWWDARDLCKQSNGDLIHKTLERRVGRFRVSYAEEIKRKLSPFSNQDVWVGISTDDYYFTLLDGRKMTEVDLLYNWDIGQPGRGREIVAGIRYGRTLHDFSGRQNFYGVCERIVES